MTKIIVKHLVALYILKSNFFKLRLPEYEYEYNLAMDVIYQVIQNRYFI